MKLLDLIKSVRLFDIDMVHEDADINDEYASIVELDINTFTAYGLEYYKEALNANVIAINGLYNHIVVGDVDPDAIRVLLSDLAGYCASTHYGLCFKDEYNVEDGDQ